MGVPARRQETNLAIDGYNCFARREAGDSCASALAHETAKKYNISELASLGYPVTRGKCPAQFAAQPSSEESLLFCPGRDADEEVPEHFDQLAHMSRWLCSGKSKKVLENCLAIPTHQ